MTRKEQISVTGAALAFTIRGRCFQNVKALDRAIEEVADDMHGAQTIAGQFLVADSENGDRDWKAILREARRAWRAMGGNV